MSWDLLNIDIWRQHIDNVPQDEISRYVAVSIFWHTPRFYQIFNALNFLLIIRNSKSLSLALIYN